MTNLALRNPFQMRKLLNLEEVALDTDSRFPVDLLQDFKDLLDDSIILTEEGSDLSCIECLRFYDEALPFSLKKIVKDIPALLSRDPNTLMGVFESLILLIVRKWSIQAEVTEEHFFKKDLLCIIFSSKPVTVFKFGAPNEFTNDSPLAQGLVGRLIGHFGTLGGFSLLRRRLQKEGPELELLEAMLSPFGCCSEILAEDVLKFTFEPILRSTTQSLESMIPIELQEKERNCILNIIEALIKLSIGMESEFHQRLIILHKNVIHQKTDEDADLLKSLLFLKEGRAKLKLQSSYAEMAERSILITCLGEFLDSPESLDIFQHIVSFKIKSGRLTPEDEDSIWNGQFSKAEPHLHSMIIHSVYSDKVDELLRKFIFSLTTGTEAERKVLHRLIKRLIQELKDEVATKASVLDLLWSSIKNEENKEIMKVFIDAHIEISSWPCGQEENNEYKNWLQICQKEIKPNSKSLVPSLHLIKAILANERVSDSPCHCQISSKIDQCIMMTPDDLETLLAKVIHTLIESRPVLGSEEVKETLSFIKFVINHGSLWLLASPANHIWNCLTSNKRSEEDREISYEWFKSLVEGGDFNPEDVKTFFEENVLKLEYKSLSPSGFECFYSFFKTVNFKEGKLSALTGRVKNIDVNGMEYLWGIHRYSDNEIVVSCAIDVLRFLYTHLDHSLVESKSITYTDIIESLFNKLAGLP